MCRVDLDRDAAGVFGVCGSQGPRDVEEECVVDLHRELLASSETAAPWGHETWKKNVSWTWTEPLLASSESAAPRGHETRKKNVVDLDRAKMSWTNGLLFCWASCAFVGLRK